MKKLKSAVTGAALVAAAGGALLAGASPALATGTPPPWAPGGVSQDGQAVGGITFFNAAGQAITSGPSVGAPFAAYAVGLSQTRAAVDTTATLFGYVPQSGLTPDNWHNNEQLGGSPSYPDHTAPGAIGTTSLPEYTAASDDEDLATLESDFPNSSSDPNFNNVYEIRLYTGRAGSAGSVTYDYADIAIDNTAHTWSLVFTPDAAAGTATTSTLTSSATTVNQGDTVTLTDTVAPAGATGTVQFTDNGGSVGSPVTVTGGVATTTESIATSGAHSVQAVYTPAALSGFSGSTSNAVTITAAHVLTNTSVALAINPQTGPAFSATTLTATTTPAAAAGQVKFFDAGAQIGVSNVAAGSATLNYSGFAQGDHNAITATFTPSDATSFNPSTSAPVDFLASAPAGALPDQQNIDADVAPGSLAITTPYTPTNPLHVGTLTLNANGTELTGSAQFGDGSTPDGSIKVVDTLAGNANWTASAASSDLTDGPDSIDQQNVGLTALHGIFLPGNALQTGGVTLTDNAAADPAVAPGAAGNAGLGGGAHVFAKTTAGGDGTVGIFGTLTITAPTSTQAGHYTGTVTFTVV